VLIGLVPCAENLNSPFLRSVPRANRGKGEFLFSTENFKIMDKEIFIQNEIVSLVMRGWNKTDAKREAEERYDDLYSNEDSESE
jgi:hypothetical protein